MLPGVGASTTWLEVLVVGVGAGCVVDVGLAVCTTGVAPPSAT